MSSAAVITMDMVRLAYHADHAVTWCNLSIVIQDFALHVAHVILGTIARSLCVVIRPHDVRS